MNVAQDEDVKGRAWRLKYILSYMFFPHSLYQGNSTI